MSSQNLPGKARRPSSKLLRLLIMRPALLAILTGTLWISVHSNQLDFSERQKLNREVLTSAVAEHIMLSLIATTLIVSIAVPLGILLSRPSARWITPGTLAMANAGQAFPTVGLVTLLAFTLGFGTATAISAITISGVLPTLHNTITGLRAVDPAIVQAARGMGMRARQALVRVELPLAVPVILAGIRTTTVLAVGMATLAAFIDGGGLGSLIIAGEKMQRTSVLLTGALLTTVLAFALDWLARLAEELLRPRGL